MPWRTGNGRGRHERIDGKKRSDFMTLMVGVCLGQVPCEVRWDWDNCQEGPVIPSEEALEAL